MNKSALPVTKTVKLINYNADTAQDNASLKANYKIIVWLVSAAIMVMMSVTVSFWAFKQVQTSAEQRKHIRIMLDEGNALLSSLKDAETGQRGYLLTGDEAFLQPYLAVRNNISRQLQTLRQGTEISSAQKHLDAMQPLIKAKLAALATLIELRRQNDLIAMTKLISVGEDRRLMEAIRVEMNSFIHIKEAQRAKSAAEFEMNMRNLLLVIVVTSLFTLLFALAFAYLFYQETKNTLLLETQRWAALGEDTNQKLEQSNLALQVSEENLNVTLSSIGDAVIITLQADDGNIETVSATAEPIFGYSTVELIKQNLKVLIPDHNTFAHYSTNNETLSSKHEVIGRRKDGSLFAVEMVIKEIVSKERHYFTCVLRDITARKQAEILQSAIFNSANFSSIATDEKGVIQIFNVGAERMLGYMADEVIDKITPAEISDSHELIARAEALTEELFTPITPGFEALVFKAARGIEDIYELTYIRKDGSRFPAVVSVTALRDVKGGIIGYLLIGTDNTARKQVDAERVQLYNALKEKNLELETATLLAEKSNLAKSEFLSKMSHELRTPLNAILGFAQLLEAGSPALTSSQIVRLQQIIKAGWYLLELINEILDLAVIESGKISLSNEAVSMTEVMRECQSMIESQAEKRGITMIFMPFDNSLCAYGDRTRIKQIIINLLSNAIKYNCEDGTVEASCTSTADHITIHIKDSGQGLTVEQLAQLFQPFNRLGQEAGNEEGTGIGLVVTKQLVELMGGSIRVNSTVGIGSEFHIELLRDVTPQLEISNITLTKLLPPASENLPVRTLLYVEDNPANLLLVEQIIEAHPQLSMLSASDSYQGLSLARSHLPDIILMDINLPGISGIQTMNILRNNPTTMHIPVIALSANAMSHDIEKGLEAGFFRYLTKPIKITEFMNALDDALKFSKATVENTHETDTCHD